MVRDEIIGRQIVGVVESQKPEHVQINDSESGDWIYYRWYLKLDNGLVALLESQNITLLPAIPEPVQPTRINATRWVTGSVYFQDAFFFSEAVRQDCLARTPFARKHELLSEADTENCLRGLQITEIVIADEGLHDQQLILVLSERNHLSVWNQERGNLLQFDELSEERDVSPIEDYRLFFENAPCDIFGRQLQTNSQPQHAHAETQRHKEG